MLKQFLVGLVVIVLLIRVNLVSADELSVELYAVDYPPYMILEESGVFSGVDVDVTKAAFAAVGIEVKVLTAPWKRILKSLQHGRISGAFSCSKRADRASFISYSDPVSEVHQVAVMAKETDVSKLVNFMDLKKFNVVAVEGWGIQKELERRNIPHATTQAMDNGIKSVIYRDVDIFYSGELAALYRARQLGVQQEIKTKRFADKASSSLHLCLSKAASNTPLLLEKFNQGLVEIKASGEFESIYLKYF